MKESFVVHSQVLARECQTLPGGTYAEYTIACGNALFKPGQYLMLRALKHAVSWPDAYLIHAATGQGFKVLAHQGQELARCAAGDRVEYWGPRGSSPVTSGDALLLVAQPETVQLVYPFTLGNPHECLVLTGEAAIARALDKIAALQNKKAILALNPDTLAQLDEAGRARQTPFANCFLYVSNKKACGINACKGCYLHSPTRHFGINACCQGPFMPYTAVDVTQDGNCFEYFSLQEVAT